MNQSLHATATSRLYQAGVDEQLMMEITGHRSLEGVRTNGESYKRSSDTQHETLSDIPNCSKRPRVENVVQQSPHVQLQLSSASMVFSATQHSQELSALSLPSAVFNGCTVMQLLRWHTPTVTEVTK